MKKKLIITSSLITILLALFPVSLYAEEVVQDPAPANSSGDGVLLDSYFYQNYDLLPYIQSSGSEYINTGINPSSDLIFYMKFAAKMNVEGVNNILFGSSASQNNYYGYIFPNNGILHFALYNGYRSTYVVVDNLYSVHELTINEDNFVIDNELPLSFTPTTLTNNNPIYLFNRNPISDSTPAIMKLYKCSIYNSSLNDGEGAYVRYFYPAKAKSSDTIGLYDAVSKTFFPSLGSEPFANPTDDKVLNFQIGDFITAGLDWIGDILDFVIDEPMLLFFMAVGLAGAMYRWARRLVHF